MATYARGETQYGRHSDLDRLQTSYQDFHDDESDEESPPIQQTDQGGAGNYSNFTRGRPTFFGSPKTPGRPGAEGDLLRGHKRYYGGAADESPGGVIIHHVPEESKSRWSHIEDLDSFFIKVYEYHQKHGFNVMMLQVRILQIKHREMMRH